MFDINDKTRLEAAYIFLRAMSAAPVPAENSIITAARRPRNI